MLRATMELKRNASDRAITHEFGHALGFIEEMAHTQWHRCAEAFNVELYAKERLSSLYKQDRQKAIDLATRAVLKAHEGFAGPAPVSSDSFQVNSVMAYRIRRKYFDADKLRAMGLKVSNCALTEASATPTKSDINLFLDYYGA